MFSHNAIFVGNGATYRYVYRNNNSRAARRGPFDITVARANVKRVNAANTRLQSSVPARFPGLSLSNFRLSYPPRVSYERKRIPIEFDRSLAENRTVNSPYRETSEESKTRSFYRVIA